MLERFFRLKENETTVRTEVVAGITTFLTMAYIIFLQPAILSGAFFGMETGMDFGAVMMATCLSAALATLIMGLYARYPVAQAPGMGANVFFVLTVLPAAALLPAVKSGETTAWQVALGVVLISGLLFLLLSLLRVREMIITALSPSLKNGIAVGIGLFIAFIGLQNAGVIEENPGTLVQLNTSLGSPDWWVFATGLIVMSALHVRRVRGSILIGILAATAMTILLYLLFKHGPASWAEAELVKSSKLMTLFRPATGIVSHPPSLAPTAFRMDLRQALGGSMIPFILIFLFMDLFDTVGTLIGVAEQAGFMRDNKLPRARQALLSDAVGTVAGAALGTSTVTSYIESTAGVEQGGRTGLTSVVTALGFLLAIFFSPVIGMIGSYPPITASALVLVGAMMIQNVRHIDWDDYSEGIPAFLTMIGIPLSYSIADGLALGFISYPIIKFLGGKGKDVSRLMAVMAVVLLLYFTLLR